MEDDIDIDDFLNKLRIKIDFYGFEFTREREKIKIR